jgi:hypothetical protein
MLRNPRLSALLEQAARNLDTLERLVRIAGEEGVPPTTGLKERLDNLKTAYRIETDALTHEVLQIEIERRVSADRRRSTADRRRA